MCCGDGVSRRYDGEDVVACVAEFYVGGDEVYAAVFCAGLGGLAGIC